MALCYAFSAHADSIVQDGVTISYEGATGSTLSNGNVVLVYTDVDEAGTFTLPKNAKARILLVGGGGAGGTMGVTVDRGAGGGGGAGGYVERTTTFAPGSYSVNVGRGGQRVQTIVQSWTGESGQHSRILMGGECVGRGLGRWRRWYRESQ